MFGRLFMLRITPVLLGLAALASAQTPCGQLKSLNIPNTKITMAENVAAGPFRPSLDAPDQGKNKGKQPATLTVPAFCRVAATLTPSSDSLIDIEVWLPADWNGKYQAVGGGG